MTAGRSNENGGRFAGGHFAGGHDEMANLCKPIMAYDFHVKYNKREISPYFEKGWRKWSLNPVCSSYQSTSLIGINAYVLMCVNNMQTLLWINFFVDSLRIWKNRKRWDLAGGAHEQGNITFIRVIYSLYTIVKTYCRPNTQTLYPDKYQTVEKQQLTDNLRLTFIKGIP